jgi:hypothetical protein
LSFLDNNGGIIKNDGDEEIDAINSNSLLLEINRRRRRRQNAIYANISVNNNTKLTNTTLLRRKAVSVKRFIIL